MNENWMSEYKVNAAIRDDLLTPRERDIIVRGKVYHLDYSGNSDKFERAKLVVLGAIESIVGNGGRLPERVFIEIK